MRKGKGETGQTKREKKSINRSLQFRSPCIFLMDN